MVVRRRRYLPYLGCLVWKSTTTVIDLFPLSEVTTPTMVRSIARAAISAGVCVAATFWALGLGSLGLRSLVLVSAMVYFAFFFSSSCRSRRIVFMRAMSLRVLLS